MFLLSPGGGVPQIAGTESVAGTILSLAGGQNIASHAEYKTYSGEAIIAANPDVIVVTTQSLASADGKKQLGNVAGVTRTAAWKISASLKSISRLFWEWGHASLMRLNSSSSSFIPILLSFFIDTTSTYNKE